jgi:hypothetical protein
MLKLTVNTGLAVGTFLYNFSLSGDQLILTDRQDGAAKTYNQVRGRHEAKPAPLLRSVFGAERVELLLSRLAAGTSTTVWHNYAMIARRAARSGWLMSQRAKLPKNSTHIILSGYRGKMACSSMVSAHVLSKMEAMP